MIRGAIPDDIPNNLQEQILLQDAKAQPAIMIQGGSSRPLGDAPRLVANYGGQPSLKIGIKWLVTKARLSRELLLKSIGIEIPAPSKMWSTK